MNALWRKSFFCKPYTGDRADALRFKDEFEEAAALKNADSDYTMQDVLRGFDLGGVNGPEIVPAVRPPPWSRIRSCAPGVMRSSTRWIWGRCLVKPRFHSRRQAPL